MKDNKTIAQFLGIKDFPYEIKDNNGKTIYFEESKGNWWKYEYDLNNNIIYYEESTGYWSKQEYDSFGNQIYFEDSRGSIILNRSKVIELTLEQIAEKFGTNVSNIKIKK